MYEKANYSILKTNKNRKNKFKRIIHGILPFNLNPVLNYFF